MSNDRVILVSDVHLGAVPDATEHRFVSWLEWAGGRTAHLVINGDLFDFWFEYGSVVPRGHTRVLGALRSLTDSGVSVTFMGGNHDWWGGTFLRDEIGLEVLHDPVVRELAGHRTLLAHGDGLGRGDLGYRALRLVLRGRLTRWAFRWLHPDVGARVARRVSRTGPMEEEPESRRSARSAALERWAREQIADDPDLDLVLLGHTHDPRLIEVSEGRWYVNSGDWVDHSSYVVLEPDMPPKLEEWDG